MMPLGKMDRAIIFSALAVLAAAMPAFHAEARRRQPQPVCDPVAQAARRAATPVAVLIAGFDGNGDARVDRAELRAGSERMFTLADGNGDGMVSLIELARWSTQWLGSPDGLPGRFDFDRDQDDKVSKAEFGAELLRRFTALDTDHDGMVTRAEILVAPPMAGCTAEAGVQPPANKPR